MKCGQKCFGRPGPGRILINIRETLKGSNVSVPARSSVVSPRPMPHCGTVIAAAVCQWAEPDSVSPTQGLLWSCKLVLGVTITDVVNLWQSSSVSDRIM
jgi:hypothetical protein